MQMAPSIDGIINWEEFYSRYVRGRITPAGRDKMHACCPFHDEHNPSFWFNTKNGMWKCEAGCGQGNATVFLAKAENISTGEAFKKLCEIAGVNDTSQSDGAAAPAAAQYTVEEYAFEKRLPVEFLSSLGVKTGYKNRYVEIPYMDEDGAEVALRKRMPPGSRARFLWKQGAKPTLYGLWRMQDITESGSVILVEGESDAQTLWFLGFPALGMPGATNFNAEAAERIKHIPTIYLHVEPDRGGQTARRKVAEALLEVGYDGTLKAWSCAEHKGLKDPSALYCEEGADAANIIQAILETSKETSIEAAALNDIRGLEDAPIKLKTPEGFDVSASGIFKKDPKTGIMQEIPFCPSPMLITQIMRGEYGEEKVELAYYWRHWNKVVTSRGIIASSRNIVALAENGVKVTTGNAADLVRFLMAQEVENKEIIPVTRRITHYGWIGDGEFAPFVNDIFFDAEGYGQFATVGQGQGTLQDWCAAMKPHRERALFRFILSASFAAPFLKILGQRIFMVYNWGDSKGGKTAALMAALSAWGNPEDMRMSFNSTLVALERTVSFFSDLPIGINERQLAGSKQEYLEKLVYMLSEGKGRGRGNRNGGLQEQARWRSVILANGEEPISGDASQTGINTRVLELYGKPFDSEDEASAMYNAVAENYGTAGKRFIEALKQIDGQKIKALFKNFVIELSGMCKHGNKAHINSIACVCIADVLVDSVLFGGDGGAESVTKAFDMATNIFEMLVDTDAGDVNQRAYQYMKDWVTANDKQFTDDFTGGTRYGLYEQDDRDHVLILPAFFDKALSDKGFSPKKTRMWLAEKGLIDSSIRSDRGMNYAVQRRFEGRRTWFVRLSLKDETEATEPPTPPRDEGFTQLGIDEIPEEWRQ